MNFNGQELDQLIGEASKRIHKPDHELPILSEAILGCADLLTSHWERMRDIRSTADGSKLTTTLSIEVDDSGVRPKVKTKISYARKFSDDREIYVDDPSQTQMSFSEDSDDVDGEEIE